MQTASTAVRPRLSLWLVAPATALLIAAVVLLLAAGVRVQSDGEWTSCDQGAWLPSGAFLSDSADSATGVLYSGESGWLARSLTDHRSVDICGDATDHRSQEVWTVVVAGVLGCVAALPLWGRGSLLVFALVLSAVALYLIAGTATEGPLLSMGLAAIGTTLFAADEWRRWGRARSKSLPTAG